MFDGVKVPAVLGRSRYQIEKVAENLLRVHAPTCLETPEPTPVLKLFDQVLPKLGFSPEIADLAPGLEGMTNSAAKTVTLASQIYEGLERGDGRSRFAAAHEIGHVLLHAQGLGTFVSGGGSVAMYRRSQLRPFQDPEWQANTFAAALLMPAAMVKKLIENVSADLPAGFAPISFRQYLARAFRVSLLAAQTRLTKLGIEP